MFCCAKLVQAIKEIGDTLKQLAADIHVIAEELRKPKPGEPVGLKVTPGVPDNRPTPP